jgi:hypothetical protein
MWVYRSHLHCTFSSSVSTRSSRGDDLLLPERASELLVANGGSHQRLAAALRLSLVNASRAALRVAAIGDVARLLDAWTHANELAERLLPSSRTNQGFAGGREERAARPHRLQPSLAFRQPWTRAGERSALRGFERFALPLFPRFDATGTLHACELAAHRSIAPGAP